MEKINISYKNVVQFSSHVYPQYARTLKELNEKMFNISNSIFLCDFDNLLLKEMYEQNNLTSENLMAVLPFYGGVGVLSYTNCDFYLVPGYTSALFSGKSFRNCHFHSPTTEKTFLWKNKKCSLETIHNPAFHWIARYEDNSIAYLQEKDIVKILATHPVYKYLIPRFKNGELDINRFCLGIDRESYGETYSHKVEESESFAYNCIFDITTVSTLPSTLLLHPKGLDENWTNIIQGVSVEDFVLMYSNEINSDDLFFFSKRIELGGSYLQQYINCEDDDIYGALLANPEKCLVNFYTSFPKKYLGIIVFNFVLFPVSCTVPSLPQNFTTESGQSLTLTILNSTTAVADSKLVVKLQIA